MAKKQLKGIIVSDKMDKTVVVKVEESKIHPIYRKRFKKHRRFKAHNEEGKYKTGDHVIIEESRPLSKDKKWIVKGLIK